MKTTFRLGKKVKYQGMTLTACFLVFLAACSSVFFLEEPAKHGFKGEHSVVVVGGMSVAVFGTMLLMSIYIWVAYYVERLTVDGTMLSIRSMFQNRQFDVSELRCLKWRIYPLGGSIKFGVLGSNARLDLHGYDKKESLQIIRVLRKLVPPQAQEGWPIFCHKVALPLRDGKPSKMRVDPTAEYFTITRIRYDRMLAFAFPVSLALVIGLWVFFGLWQFTVLPLLVIAAWLLLRFNVPREGRAETRLTSTPQGRGQLIGWGAVVGAQLVMISLALIGVEKSIACTVGCVIMLSAFPPMFYFLYKADNQRKAEDKRGAESAAEVWLRGEVATSGGEEVFV
jgi:hypothetical protein